MSIFAELDSSSSDMCTRDDKGEFRSSMAVTSFLLSLQVVPMAQRRDAAVLVVLQPVSVRLPCFIFR